MSGRTSATLPAAMVAAARAASPKVTPQLVARLAATRAPAGGCDTYSNERTTPPARYNNNSDVGMWSIGIKSYWTFYYNYNLNAWRVCTQSHWSQASVSKPGQYPAGWEYRGVTYDNSWFQSNWDGDYYGEVAIHMYWQFDEVPYPCRCWTFSKRKPNGWMWVHGDGSWAYHMYPYS